MTHDRSLLASDPTHPPCTNLSREERLAEKRRRQALVSEARCKGFGPTGRPALWQTERWPAEDSVESILAWLCWALDHLTHTLLPELEVPSAYKGDAMLIVHHLAAKGIYAPEGLPVGDDVDSVRALLAGLARWLEGNRQAGSKRKRGRPKRSYEEIERERALAEEWNRAREVGAHKSEWADEHGMSVKELNQLLDRVRKYDQPRKKSLGK